MTTERPAARPAPASASSNLTLYLATLLASTYLLAWWVFAGRSPTATGEPPAVAGTEAAAPPAGRVTWYRDLPPTARPVVDLPAGWRLATTDPSVAAPARRDALVAVRRAPVRIRTRSS